MAGSANLKISWAPGKKCWKATETCVRSSPKVIVTCLFFESSQYCVTAGLLR